MAKKSSAHTLEFILLGLIQEEPAHGYALYETLRTTPELTLIWQVKRGKLYYLLDKLEGEALLRSSPSKASPYPERKVYRITPAGAQAFQDWLHAPVSSTRYVRLAFLSKLYFASRSGDGATAELISAQMKTCRDWLASLQQAYQQLGQGQDLSGQVYQFRIGQIKAMLAWLQSCQANLAAGGTPD